MFPDLRRFFYPPGTLKTWEGALDAPASSFFFQTVSSSKEAYRPRQLWFHCPQNFAESISLDRPFEAPRPPSSLLAKVFFFGMKVANV